jgi:hypothetical protein
MWIEVLLDSLDLDETGIMFRVHLSKGALKSYKYILPCGNGAFPIV